MALDVDTFVVLRPFAYHVTDRRNVPRLRRLGCIQSAADLLRRAGQENKIRHKRATALTIVVDGENIVLKDQRPLSFASAAIAPCWSSEDFVEHLNWHVYFWPGKPGGPVASGSRLHKHYLEESPAVIRVPTEDLLSENQCQVPLFCPYNSGAPRKWNGYASPRGPDLFRTAAEFSGTAHEVVELVFRRSVQLPRTTELSLEPGKWATL